MLILPIGTLPRYGSMYLLPPPGQDPRPGGSASSGAQRPVPGLAGLSLLALKLTRTRRVSHVDDLLADPAAGMLAGLAVLPKKSALTDYSYRLSLTTSSGSCPPWTRR